MVEEFTVLEGAEIIEATDSCLVAEVNGIEVYVGPHVNPHACDCCGPITEIRISYNRPQNVDGDPLGLEN